MTARTPVLKLNPQQDGIWKWGFWEVIMALSGMGLVLLLRRPRTAPSPLQCENTVRRGVCETESRLSPDIKFADAFILDLPASRM